MYRSRISCQSSTRRPKRPRSPNTQASVESPPGSPLPPDRKRRRSRSPLHSTERLEEAELLSLARAAANIGSIEYDHDGSGSEGSIYADCLSTFGEDESQEFPQTHLSAVDGEEAAVPDALCRPLLDIENDLESSHLAALGATCSDSSSITPMEVHRLPWYNSIEFFAAQGTDAGTVPETAVPDATCRSLLDIGDDLQSSRLAVLDAAYDDGSSVTPMEVHRLPWYDNMEPFAAQGTDADTVPACTGPTPGRSGVESNGNNLTSAVAQRLRWNADTELDINSAPGTAQSPDRVSQNQSSHILQTDNTLPPPQNRALLNLALSMISHQELRYRCMMLHLRDQNDISRKEADALSRLRGLMNKGEEMGASDRPRQEERSFPLEGELDVVKLLDHELIILGKLQDVFEDAMDALERLRASTPPE